MPFGYYRQKLRLCPSFLKKLDDEPIYQIVIMKNHIYLFLRVHDWETNSSTWGHATLEDKNQIFWFNF